tara:strand:+ start:512 stop:1048 length:537 start_codon:yes stop_codon:yes gene_type:complete
MNGKAKGTMEAIDFHRKQIRLIEARNWVYVLDDAFQVEFKDIASGTDFNMDSFSYVAKFNVVIEDAAEIGDRLLPWFKAHDFKCVSIEDRVKQLSWESDTKDYTLRWRQEVTEEQQRVTLANSRWDFAGDHWEVILKVAFTGDGCEWIDVPTGEYREIPAVEAKPAQRVEITRRELQC